MNGLETERLRLRRWEERDRDRFHALSCEPAVMRFFPFRRTRAEADAAMDALNARLESDGLTFLALERKADRAVIGLAGMARLDPTYRFAEGVEIGWRLMPFAWGKGYATEAGRACLDFGFRTLGLHEIVSYCVVANRSSEAVMIRLGFSHAGEFDHPRVDLATHPDLVRHSLYRLRRETWLPANG